MEELNASPLSHHKNKYNYVFLEKDNDFILDLSDIDAFIERCTKKSLVSVHHERIGDLSTRMKKTACDEQVKNDNFFINQSSIAIDTASTDSNTTVAKEDTITSDIDTDLFTHVVDDTIFDAPTTEIIIDDYDYDSMLNLNNHVTEEDHDKSSSLDDLYTSLNNANNIHSQRSSFQGSATFRQHNKPKISNAAKRYRKREKVVQKQTPSSLGNDTISTTAESKLSVFDRSLYAILSSLFYATGGVVIDVMVAVLQATLANSFSSILWLFTPILMIIGFFVGFISDQDTTLKNQSVNMEGVSITHEVINGIFVAIIISVVVWLFLILVT